MRPKTAPEVKIVMVYIDNILQDEYHALSDEQYKAIRYVYDEIAEVALLEYWEFMEEMEEHRANKADIYFLS